MKDLAPNTPVVVGIGFCKEKLDDPLASSEPYQLMVNAVRDAAEDAGNTAILEQIDTVSIQQGMWEYTNPGKLVADAVGSPNAKTILADLGVLQLTPFFEMCQSIANGEQDIGVVTGGEAKFRELRSKITGQPVTNTVQEEGTPAPDVHHKTADPFATPLEADAGIFMPVEFFSIIESALRYDSGRSVEEHRDHVANLYSSFSDITLNNPHAWKQESVPAQDIRNATEKNSMLAFPYTKKHNTQWNVNLGVAIIVCSAKKAKELGLDQERFIYPVSAAQSKHVICLAQQKQLHSHPGTIMAGEKALEIAGVTTKDIQVSDMYSCFPAAVQSFAKDLKLEPSTPLSVTGCMAFAGGPYNHAALDGAARMVEVIRSGEGFGDAERRVGLVSNLSGIFGKEGIAIFSNEPNENGYGFEDITEAVAKVDIPIEEDGDHRGPATIVGYTVVYNKQGISHGIAFCDTPEGKRTVVKTLNIDLLTQMTQEEFVGREIEVLEGRDFALPAA